MHIFVEIVSAQMWIRFYLMESLKVKNYYYRRLMQVIIRIDFGYTLLIWHAVYEKIAVSKK